MRGAGRKVRDTLLAAATLGALSTGATAAFARPAEAEAPPTCRPDQCNTYCVSRHGPFAHGECWGDDCICAI